MPEVSVIILNWNQPHYTVPCVESVLAQDYDDFEIIIVDNGSKDDSVAIFKEKFGSNPKITLVENKDNRGYAGGNNAGVPYAKGEYIAILNNDTTVCKDWLPQLLRVIREDSQIAAVSSYEIREGKLVDPNLQYYHQSRMCPLLYGVVVKRKQPLKQVDWYYSTNLKGFSFLYNPKIIRMPFDDDYFIYSEETKLSWQLLSQGYKLATSTKAQVVHYHNVTKKENKSFSAKAVFLGERNRLMNMLTFFEPWTTLKLMPLLALQTAAVNVIRWRSIVPRLKAYWWVVRNGKKIAEKRREIQSKRTVSDKKIFNNYYTWKVWPPSSSLYKRAKQVES